MDVLKTIFGDTEAEGCTVERGGYTSSDQETYRNKPVGWVCGKNYFHDMANSDDPLRVTGTFSKCLIAWKASPEASWGEAEILVDGKTVMTLKGGAGKWNQSEIVLPLDEAEAAEHTVEIRMTEKGKRFTITAIAIR